MCELLVGLPDVKVLDVVVIDDGSTDGTADVVRSVVGDLDAAIRLLTQPERAGKAVAINRAIAESSAEVIALSDATALWDRGARARPACLFPPARCARLTAGNSGPSHPCRRGLQPGANGHARR